MDTAQNTESIRDVSMFRYVAIFIGALVGLQLFAQLLLWALGLDDASARSGGGLVLVYAASVITCCRFAHTHKRTFTPMEQKRIRLGSWIAITLLSGLSLVVLFLPVDGAEANEIPLLLLLAIWLVCSALQFFICRFLFGKHALKQMNGYLEACEKKRLAKLKST